MSRCMEHGLEVAHVLWKQWILVHSILRLARAWGQSRGKSVVPICAGKHIYIRYWKWKSISRIQAEGLPHFKCHEEGQFNIVQLLGNGGLHEFHWVSSIDIPVGFWQTPYSSLTLQIKDFMHGFVLTHIMSLTSEAFADHAFSPAWRWWQGWACHTWSTRWSMSLVAYGLDSYRSDHGNIILTGKQKSPQ